jgi:hypothetical protein
MPATAEDREATARLVDAYRACQRERVAQLAQRYGSGPKLRHHQEQLASGGLLAVFASERLEQDAARDQQARTEQERLRVGYLAWREHEARRRKHDIPLHARLAQGRAAVLALIDGEQLRVCSSCGEIAYPAEPVSDPRRYAEWRPRREPPRCHFCGAHKDATLRRGNPTPFLLSGLVRCQHCGRVYVGTSAHGRKDRYTYYACSTRYKQGRTRCQGQRLSKERLEHAVLTQLATIYRDGQLINDALTHAAEQASTRSSPPTASHQRFAQCTEQWAIQDSNLGPPPYQRGALTN